MIVVGRFGSVPDRISSWIALVITVLHGDTYGAISVVIIKVIESGTIYFFFLFNLSRKCLRVLTPTKLLHCYAMMQAGEWVHSSGIIGL